MEGSGDKKSDPEEEIDCDNGAGVNAAVTAPSEDANALGYIPDEANRSLQRVSQDADMTAGRGDAPQGQG